MRFKQFMESYDKLGKNIKKGHSLEARGVKGADKEEWAKSFKDKAELDAWAAKNDAKIFGIAYADKLEESIGATPWDILMGIVEKDHGEQSICDLTASEAGKLLDLGAADKAAGEEFFELSTKDMKKIVNANPDFLKGKAAKQFKAQLTEDEDLNEASPGKDGIMPTSYKTGAGHKIEAYGVKGMDSKKWRKSFKDHDALEKWAEQNDAEVHGVAPI